MTAKQRLALDVGVAYVAAWVTGLGFGLAVRATGTWQLGASWERGTLRWMHEHPLPWMLDQLMLVMPYFGTNLTILPLMIVVALVIWKRFGHPLIAAHLLLVCVGSLSINIFMKHLLVRPRPAFYPLRGMFAWASYPSGHLILTPALYLTASLLLHRLRGWRWPFVVTSFITVLTAYSRLYLSVHWPTDLVGGLLIGLTWLLATWRAFESYRRRAA